MAKYVSGFSNTSGEKPEGWDELAASNSRALDESMKQLAESRRGNTPSLQQQIDDRRMLNTMDQMQFTIAKLDVKPGDTVVFKIGGLNQLMAENPGRVEEVQAQMKTFLPCGVKFLLLDSEIDISVISGLHQ